MGERRTQFDEILEKCIANDQADGGYDGEVGGVLAVVDEGEVKGEPQQQAVIKGSAKAVLQDDSEPVHVDEVLLQAVELLMQFLAGCQISMIHFHRALLHEEIEQEARRKK